MPLTLVIGNKNYSSWSLRGWLARVGQATTAAVALTVFGALLAVMILRPPDGPGQSPDPTNGATGAAPSSAAFTPLPAIHRPGDVPRPAMVLVELEQGDFALVDLTTGERSASLTDVAYGSVLGWRSDGLLCLCV